MPFYHAKGALSPAKGTLSPHTTKRMTKHALHISSLIAAIIMALTLTACGPDGKHCAVEGRFLKMNQGQFLVYSPDAIIEGVDTIRVLGGRFEYETECHAKGILVIVLPNFSELPVFVEPGQSVDIKADATHIKDIKIKGGSENKAMTEWREQNNDLKPNQQAVAAEKFIRENPESDVSRWLLHKYILSKENADYGKVKSLLSLISKANAKRQTPWTTRMSAGMLTAGNGQKGSKLPKFKATDINGKTITDKDFSKGYAIITTFCQWSYDSQNRNRQINGLLTNPDDKIETSEFKGLAISLDPSKDLLRAEHLDESDNWNIVCDGKMWDSELVKSLGLTYMPDNIILKDGKIIARNVYIDEIKKLLKRRSAN